MKLGKVLAALVSRAARGSLPPFPLDQAGDVLAAVTRPDMGGKAVLLPRAGSVR